MKERTTQRGRTLLGALLIASCLAVSGWLVHVTFFAHSLAFDAAAPQRMEKTASRWKRPETPRLPVVPRTPLAPSGWRAVLDARTDVGPSSGEWLTVGDLMDERFFAASDVLGAAIAAGGSLPPEPVGGPELPVAPSAASSPPLTVAPSVPGSTPAPGRRTLSWPGSLSVDSGGGGSGRAGGAGAAQPPPDAPIPAPEPSAPLLFGLGSLVAAGALRRRAGEPRS